MRNLELIKKRIKSVETNAKIIFAMKILSTYKLQKFKKKFATYQDYLSGFYEIFVNILNHQEQSFAEINKLFFKEPSANYQHSLWIIIGSDIGMCGGFNNALAKKVVSQYQPGDQTYFFGTRIHNTVKAQIPKLNVVTTYHQVEKLLDPEHCFWLANEIFAFFIKHKFQNLKLVYTKFINNLTFEARIFSILPIKSETFAEFSGVDLTKNKISNNYELSVKPTEMLFELIPQFFAISLYGGLLESKVSEFSARYQAMSVASDNANNLKDHYKLEYNRTRQALITQEIIEIISGSNKAN